MLHNLTITKKLAGLVLLILLLDKLQELLQTKNADGKEYGEIYEYLKKAFDNLYYGGTAGKFRENIKMCPGIKEHVIHTGNRRIDF